MRKIVNAGFVNKAYQLRSSSPILTSLALVFIVLMLPLLIVLAILALAGMRAYVAWKSTFGNQRIGAKRTGNNIPPKQEYTSYEIIDEELKC
ncbi:MAG: hypothetical protein SFW35_10065 [Chitinophagales bacterium]|nr:hypothetical protein [Chitinophagales bacterium]